MSNDRRVRVRFAPSPTGPLHIGGVRTALYNYLIAKKFGGDFILRIEDTDQNRFVPGAEEYIIEALKWVGIEPNEGVGFGDGPYAPYRQSERKAMYRQYADQLIASGHAYYAFDTAEELEEMRERLKASNISAQYDAITRMSMKNSLTMPEDEVKRKLEAGDPYVIRIKLPRKEEVKFHDDIRGWVVFNTSQMDDKVLMKGDGMPTYHLANVVDDYLMKITHVIRGEEWLPSAPLHVLLYQYLGWSDVRPSFAHLPLLLKPDGNGKLSKRDGDRLGFPVFPLRWVDPETGEVSSGYRENGYYPEAVMNMLALLGWHPSDNREEFTLNELVEAFTAEKISKHGAKFDQNKAKWFNQVYLRKRSPEQLATDVMPLLQARGWNPDLAYLSKVCALSMEKLNFYTEIPDFCAHFFGPIPSVDQEVLAKRWRTFMPGFCEAMKANLEALSDWSATAVESTFAATLQQTGLLQKDVMQAFRLAISGVGGGPPLFEMAALLGRDVVCQRLHDAMGWPVAA